MLAIMTLAKACICTVTRLQGPATPSCSVQHDDAPEASCRVLPRVSRRSLLLDLEHVGQTAAVSRPPNRQAAVHDLPVTRGTLYAKLYESSLD